MLGETNRDAETRGNYGTGLVFEFLNSAGAAGPEWTGGVNNELTNLDLVNY